MLGSHTSLTTGGKTYALRTRVDAPNLEGKGTAVRMGKWLTGYVAACMAGAGTVGDVELTCLLSGVRFNAWTEGDVDRLVPSRGYVAGNVCLVSQRANWGRGLAQDAGSDVPGIDGYVTHVQRCSAGLPHFSPTGGDMRSLYHAHGQRSDRNARQAAAFRGDAERSLALAEVTAYVNRTY